MAYDKPDDKGHFNQFGGRYVPETLIPAITELEQLYCSLKNDLVFKKELNDLMENYSGRPTPLYFAESISNELGFNVFCKREDLNHTGAHKINNALGKILLAKKMKKNRIIAETGAGMHGVATATVAAKFGMECVVYMGEEDIKRQSLNVYRMKLLGADVRSVSSGSKTLKDATNEAIRDWGANVENTYYLIGSVVGPHPYPMMVRDFQSIIGKETMAQFKENALKDTLPSAVIACVGGGSNAIGIFYSFIDKDVRLIGVEASGHGLDTKKHAATMTCGKFGVLHGAGSYLLQTKDGQVMLPHSISAGLDYPGIGPEHAFLFEQKRVNYVSVTDEEAIKAFKYCSKLEGIIPALEPSHALAHLIKVAPKMKKNKIIVMNMCGRGDKDIFTVAEKLKVKINE